MRISTNMTFDRFAYQQQRLTASLFSVQGQLITGRAVSVLSQDPLRGSQVLELTEIEERQQELAKLAVKTWPL